MLLGEKKYAWLLLAFLWIFGFIGSLGRIVTAFYQNEITSTLGVGRSFIGLTWSTSVFVGALSAPIGGWLADRYGYKKVMIGASCCQLLGIAVMLALRNPIGYFIGFGLLTGLAGIGASTNYVLVSNWFQRHRAKALMILGSAGSLGLAVLTPLLVSLGSRASWIQVYVVTLFVTCTFIPLVVLIVRNNEEQEYSSGESHSTELKGFKWFEWLTKISSFSLYMRNSVVVVVMFALFTCGLSMGTVEMHLMAIHQAAHVPDAMLSSALSLLGFLELAGGVTFSFLLDRMPRMKALACLYTIRFIAFIFLYIHVSASPLLFSFLFGATYLGAIPGGILVASEALSGGRKPIGLQTGLLLFVHQIGGVVAAIGGGIDYDWKHNYQTLIAVNATFSLTAAAAYMTLFKGVWLRKFIKIGEAEMEG